LVGFASKINMILFLYINLSEFILDLLVEWKLGVGFWFKDDSGKDLMVIFVRAKRHYIFEGIDIV
jgi:hypothetical protein